ncbi:MAG: hypothetical protein PVJ27_02270 [Candidatus Brocadiaceae bacterium]|jgi:hypothetical protein
MMQHDWKTALIVLVAVVAGSLLAGAGFSRGAGAQSEGSAGGVICVVGQERSGYAPIVLVDVPDQTLVVYEYSYANDRIELTSVRSFSFDKRLVDWQTEPPTLDEVRNFVLQRQQGR